MPDNCIILVNGLAVHACICTRFVQNLLCIQGKHAQGSPIIG